MKIQLCNNLTKENICVKMIKEKFSMKNDITHTYFIKDTNLEKISFEYIKLNEGFSFGK